MGQAALRTPWHLWAVAALSLLWNAYGGYDYLMSNFVGDAYLRQVGMTAPQIAYFNAMPAWMTAAWAIGVWGALLGGVLLLARAKWALHAFFASLGAFLLSLIYAYALSDGAEVMGGGGYMIMNGVILAGCLFFAWYAWFATKSGVLR